MVFCFACTDSSLITTSFPDKMSHARYASPIVHESNVIGATRLLWTHQMNQNQSCFVACISHQWESGAWNFEFLGEKAGDSSERSVLDIRQEVNDTAMYKSGWYKGVSEINHKSHVDINDLWIWINILMAGLRRHCTLFTICSRNLCSKDYMQYNTWRCLGILFEIVTGLRERRGKELFLCDDSYAVHSGKFRCLLHLQRLKACFPSAHGSSGQ